MMEVVTSCHWVGQIELGGNCERNVLVCKIFTRLSVWRKRKNKKKKEERNLIL